MAKLFRNYPPGVKPSHGSVPNLDVAARMLRGQARSWHYHVPALRQDTREDKPPVCLPLPREEPLGESRWDENGF